MNIFHSILQKLGIEKPAAVAPVKPAPAAVPVAPAPVAPVPVKPAAAAPAPVKPAAAVPTTPTPVAPVYVSGLAAVVVPPAPVTPAPVTPAPVHPVAIPVVDVISKLEGLASANPGLNWKTSIVDLLKLLDIDSSYDARKDLAVELGCPENLMSDSASMNIWLHKTVLQQIAENGGNIPASLLD